VRASSAPLPAGEVSHNSYGEVSGSPLLVGRWIIPVYL
jgi:hypothetical protein